jgi:glycosyltransferase involved in cell wall biosynthesis
MAGFDLFVLPSLHEGMPNALIEAMSAGVAVIATKVGGVPEVVQHEETGLLVPVKDPVALAGGIERLLENHEFRKIVASRGRTHVLEKFSMERMVHAVERLYDTLATGC